MVTTKTIILDDQFSSPAVKVIKSIKDLNKELKNTKVVIEKLGNAANLQMKKMAINANKVANAAYRMSNYLSRASKATIMQDVCEQNLQQTLKNTKKIYDKNNVSIKKHNMAVEKKIKNYKKQSKELKKLAYNAQKAHGTNTNKKQNNSANNSSLKAAASKGSGSAKTFKGKLINSLKNFKGKALKTLKNTAKQAASLACEFAKQSINAAKVQITAENRLQEVLQNTQGITGKQIAGIKRYNSVLQKQGVISKEVSLAGVSQLGSYKLQANTIKTLMPGMQDLLAKQKGLNATQQDATDIGDMVGKVMNGQHDALSQVGISFTKAQQKILQFGTESQKAAVVTDVLKANVGGVNKKLANTDSGKIQNAKNAWHNMQAEVGKKLLPVLANLYQWFGSKIPMIQTFILGVLDKVKEFVEKSKPQLEIVKSVIGFIIDKAVKLYNFISNNWSTIAPIILTIVGAMATYKLITLAQTGYTNALAAAQWAWNVAMNANPIGLVIAGIAALITAGILIVKNWDKIKATGAKLWDGLKEGVRGFANFFIKIWNWIVGKLNKFKIKIPKWVPGIGGKTFGFNLKEADLLTSPQKKVLNKVDELVQNPELTSTAYSKAESSTEAKDIAAPQNATTQQSFNTGYNADQIASLNGASGENIQIIFKGDVYGFDDFKNRVSQAFVEVYKANRANIVTV
ncbi:hypothetical protein IMX26_07550 [Clostridium sp. 'deep sea']|uniref:hypothetical protein n=1 Tax=Clostridium sp. 'deep sea' TaxID=2779445 RepID=UPI0018965023|nr:hypothetical protein [Clostridium sp. 'deep sea']QOR36651.1 hypothetical protein IMX26_07550 [Clostridium sp. 'deep sea']